MTKQAGLVQHVLDQNLLAGAVGATGVDDDWLPDTSELQPEAMARQLHRTKWAFGLVYAYLRYRVCGCRLIKLLFMHVVVLADEATVWFSIQFQLQPEFV